MLEMKDWSKETVLNKYEELKKHMLSVFEKQLDVIHGEFQKSKDVVSGATGQNIFANLNIEIEKVYVRFEDEELQFSIGFLLPKIHCLSTDRDYNPTKDITDISVVYKKLSIDDVSAFINTKKTFMPLAVLLDLDKNL